MVDNLQVRAVAFNPSQHPFEHALDMAAVVADNDACDVRNAVLVVRPNLRAGQVKLACETCEQRFQARAFFLQRRAAWKVDLEQ